MSERLTPEQEAEAWRFADDNWRAPADAPLTAKLYSSVSADNRERVSRLLAELRAVRAERDDARTRCAHVEAEATKLAIDKDTLAAALVEMRGQRDVFAVTLEEVRHRAFTYYRGRGAPSWERLHAALSALPADLAAERDRCVRAETLVEARDAIEMAFGHDEDVSAQDVIDRLLEAMSPAGQPAGATDDGTTKPRISAGS